VINDRKTPINSGNATVGYKAQVVSVSDYYSFGSEIGERTYDPVKPFYRFGFNTQEKTFELNRDHYTAKFWEYDARLGRRWNVDPEPNDGWSLYSVLFNNPLKNIDVLGNKPLDDYYIKRDGSILIVKTNDKYDRFYTETNKGDFRLEYKLDKNDFGLVLFPESGYGFKRYGPVDKGGVSQEPFENVGQGDHYLKPITAAALFGLINELREKGITLSLGDMSSSTGTDPWQKGQKHHKGHGHLGKRSGLDVDFRYVNIYGNEIHSAAATSDKLFDVEKNTLIYKTAEKYGFIKNFQGINGQIENVNKISGHDNHGHLGLDINKVNFKYVDKKHGH
jgi:hypothetical protein